VKNFLLLASIMPSTSRVLNVAVMSAPIPEPLFPKLGSNGETEWVEHEFKEEQVEMAWRVVGIHDKARKISDMKAKWELQRKEKEQPYAEMAKEEGLEAKKKAEAESVMSTGQIVIQCSGRNTLSCNKITTWTNSNYVKVIMSLIKDKSSMKYSLQCSGRNTEAESETTS